MGFQHWCGRLCKHVLPYSTRVKLAQLAEFANISFAQEGEDLLFLSALEPCAPGFYVDIGAHHPLRYSNTHLLYLRGWRGINVDPLPGTRKLFARYRPEDTTLEMGVSAADGMMQYYMFDDPALNGFCAELAEERQRETSYRVTGVVDVPTARLCDILDRYLPDEQTISLLSVDVEGLDLDVLRSNNWNRFKPIVVMVEDADQGSLSGNLTTDIQSFMVSMGYVLIMKTRATSVYCLQHHIKQNSLGMRISVSGRSSL